jgi:hypothetical protein
MRQICVFVLSLSVAAVSAQTRTPDAVAALKTPPLAPAVQTPVALPPTPVLQSKEIELATAEIERVTNLVNVGALPKARLDEAQEKLADAQDDVILARTLYGELPVQNLNPQMADDMVAAAQRRLERQIKKVNDAQKLVDDGIASKSSLDPLLDELKMRQINLNLAHSRAKLIGELANIAKYEQSMRDLQQAAHVDPYTDYTMSSMAHYEGNGAVLGQSDLKQLEAAFTKHFDRPLPISADGQTSTHDALGFAHRGRVDVAVNPNEPAGIWLRHYLEAKHVPYYAFLRAVPGKATGAHIHIGPGSARLHNAD